jgi:23S rRNA pseudoU1915 N3-methylase RlmH
MPDWVATATHDYVKRMPADCSIDIKEIKPDLTPAKEAIKIAAAIPKGSRVIALDERGPALECPTHACWVEHPVTESIRCMRVLTAAPFLPHCRWSIP